MHTTSVTNGHFTSHEAAHLRRHLNSRNTFIYQLSPRNHDYLQPNPAPLQSAHQNPDL